MTNCPTLKRVLATDSTNNTAFAVVADVATEPTVGASTGYIRLGTGPAPASKDLLMLVPVSKGADNSTFNMRVSGVFLTDEGVYTHVPLYVFGCTMSAAVGLTGKNVSELHRYCDTIVGTSLYGTLNINYQIFQQAADQRGFVLCDMLGALFAYVEFDINSGATNMNALYGNVGG